MIGARNGPRPSLIGHLSCSFVSDLETWHVKALIDVSRLLLYVIRREVTYIFNPLLLSPENAMDLDGILADLVAKASFHFEEARPLIPMYIHLILSALFPIYTGAHASLSRPSSAAKPEKKSKEKIDSDDEDEDEEKIQKMEGLSNKDAIVLPITAGLVLAGLYYLIKKYGADLINLVLGWYFSGVGVYSVGRFVNDGLEIIVNFLFPSYYASRGSLWRASNSEQKFVHQSSKGTRRGPDPMSFYAFAPPGLSTALWSARHFLKQKNHLKAYIRDFVDIQAKLTIVNVFSALVGFATIVYVNTVSKHWVLTNLQGFAVSYAALQLMSPTTFPTGSLILGALFCYDIWAVFFTPLMVTVAKNLDQPIKLMFPRPDEPGKTPDAPAQKAFSMLGLGDIVLPGIMIGLALRFDLYMYYVRKQKKVQKSEVDSSQGEAIEKAPYVSVSGHWGDRFWTFWLPESSLPNQLLSSFPKPYFTASMIGYLLGLLTTLGVMSVFQHAQPALLYLVPGVLISIWGTALIRCELKEMWNFSEAVVGEEVDEDTKDDDSAADKKQLGLFERLWQEVWMGSSEESKKETKTNESKTNADDVAKVAKEESKEAKEKAGDDVLVSITLTRPSAKSSSR
jgi:minor histocompatibility antigen H13